MHTRLRFSFSHRPVFYVFLLIFSVVQLNAKSPRTFTPHTITQMTKEKFEAPVDKRLLARKAEAVEVATAARSLDRSLSSKLEPPHTWRYKRRCRSPMTTAGFLHLTV